MRDQHEQLFSSRMVYTNVPMICVYAYAHKLCIHVPYLHNARRTGRVQCMVRYGWMNGRAYKYNVKPYSYTRARTQAALVYKIHVVYIVYLYTCTALHCTTELDGRRLGKKNDLVAVRWNAPGSRFNGWCIMCQLLL